MTARLRLIASNGSLVGPPPPLSPMRARPLTPVEPPPVDRDLRDERFMVALCCLGLLVLALVAAVMR